MKRTLLAVLIGAVLLAAAVAVLAPASLVTPYLDRVTRGRFAATEVEGALWRGQAVVTAGAARMPVAWTLDAVPLLKGELRAHVTPVDATLPSPRAEIMAAEGHLAFGDVSVTVPASVVQQALAPMAPKHVAWSADGEISASTPHLEWTPAAYQGALSLVWRKARLVLASTAVDLGEATATLTAQGNRLAGPVANRGGDLDIRGDVAIGTDGSAALSLTLTPRRADDPELTRMLAAIGTPDGAGWRVSWQTAAP